jgi:hypothetical protein
MNDEQFVSGSTRAAIYKWPDGYAAVLAGRYGLTRCCSGHSTPGAAADHGVALTQTILAESVEKWNGIL